nr:acyltransferase family protein [Aneurinibacillus tyrosinisolvens]
MLFGVALLIPVLMYIFHLHYRGYPAVSFWSYYKTYYLGMTAEPAHWIGPAWPDLNFGHLWFIENSLFYSLVYLLCTLVMKTKKAVGTAAQSAPTHTGIVLFAAALSLITFIVRIWFPIDHWIGLFGFIQMEVAHIPQYISFFVLGIMAYRRNWLQQLPARTGKVWLAVGVILAVLCYLGFAPAIQGGLSLRAFIYPFYEAFECTGLIIGLLYLFRTFFNTSSSLSKSLAQNTYAVYIIHIPVLVAFQYAFLHVALSVYLLFTCFSINLLTFSFGSQQSKR